MLAGIVLKRVFEDLKGVLLQLTSDEYFKESSNLFGATIGQHVRHSLEMFQCLMQGYEGGIVNYDDRKRDKAIEADLTVALNTLQDILDSIDLQDKNLIIQARFGADDLMQVKSSYYRELIYNMEHTIHHMALIRVGIRELTDISVPAEFGVAPSTVQYKKQCAQ